MEEKGATQLKPSRSSVILPLSNHRILSHFLCSRSQEFRERLFSGQGNGKKKFYFPSVHQGHGLPFYGLRRQTGHAEGCLAGVGGLGESTLIRESWKFSFPREVMFRLRRLSKKMGKLRCAFRGVWLDGREGGEEHKISLRRPAQTA